MDSGAFDYNLADAQGSYIEPIDPDSFDLEEYQEYEAALIERCQDFWSSESGIAVYRRIRVPQVFAAGCRDMSYSLSLQLAGLKKSMQYQADIPNFLEPWYGIGSIASAFGINYTWEKNQAPAIKAPFKSVQEALEFEPVSVVETSIGRQTLSMIEYFLNKTKGKIPVSLTDTQSPFNTASYLVETNSFFMSPYDSPEDLKRLLAVITDLLIDFTRKQVELIGPALARPGHGFASSRCFEGLGMSDDNMIMLSPEQYEEFELPCINRLGEVFQGAVFHSCGNWAAKIPVVSMINNLRMVDGAFSSGTDPDPNPAQPFADGFSGSGIVLNARIVGGPETLRSVINELRQPGMKLIVVTYLQDPDEQEEFYRSVQELK